MGRELAHACFSFPPAEPVHCRSSSLAPLSLHHLLMLHLSALQGWHGDLSFAAE